jgi:hypothetical protein
MLNYFEMKYYRKILKTRWLNKITNEKLGQNLLRMKMTSEHVKD